MSSPNIEETIPTRPEDSAAPGTQPLPADAPQKKGRKLIVVILGVVLVLASAGIGGWMGYQSGQAAKDQSQISQRAVDAATQFQLALQDQTNGRLEVAQQRLEYVISLDSNFPGATQKLTEVMVAIQASKVPTAVPTPTLTPTPDTRGEQDMFAQILQALKDSKWSTAIDSISAIRKKNIGYRTVDVDGLYYIALRGLGVTKIGMGDLEGGIYALTLAERFGPLDNFAAGYRTWARYYLNGASFWKVDWLNVLNWFTDLAAAMPNMRDGSGMTASERYRIALYQYATQIGKDDPCKARDFYARSLAIGNDPTVVPAATEAANRCAPPTSTPAPVTATNTPTPTVTGTVVATGVTPTVDTPTVPGPTVTPMPATVTPTPTTQPPTQAPTQAPSQAPTLAPTQTHTPVPSTPTPPATKTP
jgi:hypothetical protein